MISYPYYGKTTIPGDNIFFRHVDINVKDAIATGKGTNQIQGSLTVFGETDNNCTWFIPKMHRIENLKRWMEDNNARGSPLGDGHIAKILPAMWTKADIDKFQTDFQRQVAPDCTIRITHPLNFHGSEGKADSIRMTMLPWYCGIEADHSTLEIPEGGTWEQLAQAHRDLWVGPASPSGHSVNYGKLPFPFPTNVSAHMSHPISQALIGRLKWDNLSVVEAVEKIVGNANYRQHVLREQEVEMTKLIGEKFAKFIEEEKRVYGENSYFACRFSSTPKAKPEPFHMSAEAMADLMEACEDLADDSSDDDGGDGISMGLNTEW